MAHGFHNGAKAEAAAAVGGREVEMRGFVPEGFLGVAAAPAELALWEEAGVWGCWGVRWRRPRPPGRQWRLGMTQAW